MTRWMRSTRVKSALRPSTPSVARMFTSTAKSEPTRTLMRVLKSDGCSMRNVIMPRRKATYAPRRSLRKMPICVRSTPIVIAAREKTELPFVSAGSPNVVGKCTGTTAIRKHFPAVSQRDALRVADDERVERVQPRRDVARPDPEGDGVAVRAGIEVVEVGDVRADEHALRCRAQRHRRRGENDQEEKRAPHVKRTKGPRRL